MYTSFLIIEKHAKIHTPIRITSFPYQHSYLPISRASQVIEIDGHMTVGHRFVAAAVVVVLPPFVMAEQAQDAH